MKRMLALTIVLGCSGCSFQFSLPGSGGAKNDLPGPTISQTLDDLPAVPIIETIESSVPGKVVAEQSDTRERDTAGVLVLYQSVLDEIPDGQVNYDIARRVAELMMQQAEDALLRGDEAPYAGAVAAFERLLGDENSDKDRAYIRYQLARAYDLNGDQQASIVNLNKAIAESGVHTADGNANANLNLGLEARFRRAELRFSAGQYVLAAQDYALVGASPGSYQIHALYMLGWARFKQDNLDEALLPFVNALDMLLGTVNQGARRDQDLIDDTTRVAVLVLDDLGGAQKLAQTMQTLDRPAWQAHLYDALSVWYREKERFQDSANTWEAFLGNNPLHIDAPRISLQIIEIYRSAGFVDDITRRKQEFVEQYDRTGSFYAEYGAEAFESYADTLLLFFDEIVSRQHAIAQELTGKESETSAYRHAADWYRRWIVNFPDHERAAETQFLLAESLSDAGLVDDAIEAYRVVAVKYPGFSGAADALYSIVLSLAGLVSGENSQRPLIKQKLVEASTEFVSMFPADERSKATQINVAKMLFDSGDHTGAIEAAEYALNQWQLSASLGKTAALISAHSHFELGHYQLAELGYRDLLLRDRSNGEKGSSEITDRLLASVFKQAEAAELSNDIPRAIEHLLALEEIDAASDLAIDAAYDTAALYEQLGQIDQAVNQLKVFRQNHPQHAASDGIAMRLVALYEQAGRLGDSANELIAVHGSEKFSTDVQQQALFRAGELYLEDAALPQALDAFRLYAHSYRQPFGLTMEAMHHMDLLYQQTGEVQKRQFWLRKKMLAYGNADPANRDDRTRFLAVDASFILAEVELAAFRGIALKQPLNESLQKKHKAMKVAVDAFERTSAFGVAGFVEGATYHIGGIYQSLAESLMASDRPPGLNELEAEQYDILLEEQAFPFEEQAIDIHKVNLNRGWKETWNSWVGQSLTALENLSPGRYRRKEMGVPYVETLY